MYISTSSSTISKSSDTNINIRIQETGKKKRKKVMQTGLVNWSKSELVQKNNHTTERLTSVTTGCTNSLSRIYSLLASLLVIRNHYHNKKHHILRIKEIRGISAVIQHPYFSGHQIVVDLVVTRFDTENQQVPKKNIALWHKLIHSLLI